MSAESIFHLRSLPDLDWVIYILVGTLVLLAVCRLLFTQNFEALFRFEQFKEVNDNQLLFGAVFLVVFSVLTSTLVYEFLITDYDFIFYNPYMKVLAVAVIILLFLGLRFVLDRILIYAFGLNYDHDAKLKAFNYFRVYAVVFMWITVLLFYFTDIKKAVLLIVLGILLVFIRFFSFSFFFREQEQKQRRFWYYNILYLCTLEILPVLVFFKFLNVW